MSSIFQKIKTRLAAEYKYLTAVNSSDRPWEMPVAASLSMGLPLLISVHFDHLNYGLASCLGGMIFLYLPSTPMYHRMTTLMTCSFGIITCYSLGILCQFNPQLMVLSLSIIAMVVSMACRFFMLPPPGSLFFIMAASIGMYTTVDVLQVPFVIGLMTLGCVLALAVAFVYSLYILRIRPASPIPTIQKPSFDFVIFDSVIIGFTVGISLLLAITLELPRPYWVPISCLAVLQGVTVRAGWNSQLQRILGSCLGLIVSWFLLTLSLGQLSICFVMMGLSFIIESLAVRHFGLAVVFLTPLTIFLAEANRFGLDDPFVVIRSRVTDTLLGSVIGVVCGLCLHSEKFRTVVGHQMRKLIPVRF